MGIQRKLRITLRGDNPLQRITTLTASIQSHADYGGVSSRSRLVNRKDYRFVKMKLSQCPTMKMAAAGVSVAIVVTALAGPSPMGTEETELRNLDVTRWECKSEGNAQTQEVRERNQVKNRSPLNLCASPVESLDTACILRKSPRI